MANSKNLKKPFTKANQPAGARKSRKGIPNRATVFKRLLELKTKVTDPEKRGQLQVTLYEAMALGQIQSAMKGNTRAFQEIQDSLFGKQSNVNLNLSADELKNLTDAELDDLIAKFSR